MALRLRQMELSTKTVCGPVLKITQLSAHSQNHVSIERCRKSFNPIVLGNHDFPLTASNFGNMTAFRAIFSHIFTAHAQKRLFMNFRLKFWHHRSIPWSRFPYRAWYFGDLRTFFCTSGSVTQAPGALQIGLLFMVALCNRETIYIFMLWFVLLPSFFFFSPRLISAAVDWMSTILRHVVWS